MTYLITGATGPVGRHLVARLLEEGHDVRVTTRTPDVAEFPAAVDVVGGDFTSGTLANRAFDGVDGAFVFPAQSGVEPFLSQAAAAEVQHLVVLSSLAAAGNHERDRGSISNLHHLAVEQSVAATGLPATVLRPGDFANNLLFWAHSIRTTGSVFAPYPKSAQAPIHEADVADVAAVALTSEAHRGRIYPMTGPEALTRAEQLGTIAAAIDRDLAFEEITPEQFTESMSQYMPPGVIKMLLNYWSDTVDEPDRILTTVTDVTGRPARSLGQWATDHAAAFAA